MVTKATIPAAISRLTEVARDARYAAVDLCRENARLREANQELVVHLRALANSALCGPRIDAVRKFLKNYDDQDEER